MCVESCYGVISLHFLTLNGIEMHVDCMSKLVVMVMAPESNPERPNRLGVTCENGRGIPVFAIHQDNSDDKSILFDHLGFIAVPVASTQGSLLFPALHLCSDPAILQRRQTNLQFPSKLLIHSSSQIKMYE